MNDKNIESKKLKSDARTLPVNMTNLQDLDIQYIIAQKTNPSLDKLETFLTGKDYQTGQKSSFTNIVDQLKGRTFCIPFNVRGAGFENVDQDSTFYSNYAGDDKFMPMNNVFVDSNDSDVNSPMDELFKYLEECRIQGVYLCFSEKQYFTIPSESRTKDTTLGSPDLVDAIGNLDDDIAPSLPSFLTSNDNLQMSVDEILEKEAMEYRDDLDNIDLQDELDSLDVDYESIRGDLDKQLNDAIDVKYGLTPNEIENAGCDIDVDKSCIEFDFDIYLEKEQPLPPNTFVGILNRFTMIASRSIDWDSCSNPDAIVENRNGKTNVKFYAAVLRKPQRSISNPSESAYNKYGNCWKESFHIRIYLKVSKAFKFYFRKQMLEDEGFQDVFSGLAMKNTLDDAFDKNALSGPAMILGSSKRAGNRPHELKELYEITYRFIKDMTPIIAELNIFQSEEPDSIKKYYKFSRQREKTPEKQPLYSYNLAYEMSLNFEAPNGFIRKREFDPIPSIRGEMEAYKERIQDNLFSDSELRRYENDVTNLSVCDFKAKYISKVLDIIGPTRVSDYDSWKKVILALGRENQDYKPLAVWFSIRHGHSFLQGNALQHIDGLFAYANAHKQTTEDGREPMTVLTLYSWAMEDNPKIYDELQEFNLFKKLEEYCFLYAGDLNDTQIADSLREMFGHKFKCDESRLALGRGKTTRVWREFVFPEDDYITGQLYKWREERQPDSLELYISKKLPVYLDKILRWCETKKVDATNNKKLSKDQKDSNVKYFELVKKGVKRTQKNLGNDGRINSVIKRCAVAFRVGNRGFEDSMDADPNYLGVANGVLKLRPVTEFIQRYHEIPISKSTKVSYIPYDPNDKYIQDLEKAFRLIFANDEETYQFWMMFIASGLDGHEKDPQFFAIWHGEGSQGKSTILEFDIATFGITNQGGYSVKMDVGWFCAGRKGAGPDAAVSDTKGGRKIWTSETDQEAELVMSKIKEMTSEHISANNKNEKQDTWKVNANVVMTTNNKPRIKGRDYGAWRRLLYYCFKMMFLPKHKIDPNNPFHCEANTAIMSRWVHDPNYQQAYLSILVHHYERYRDEFGCNLRNVPKTTIDRETEEYQKEQDTITKFVLERVHFIGPTYEDGEKVSPVSVNDLVHQYIIWFKRCINDKMTISRQDTARDIKDHPKIKKFMEAYGDHQDYLTQHRVLGINENFQDISKSPSTDNAEKRRKEAIDKFQEDLDLNLGEPEDNDNISDVSPEDVEDAEVTENLEDDDSWLEEDVENDDWLNDV